ncbi:hypothetical protein N7520_011960 [Penicillium odoratum]|uniref:uncharacterized protein n=1 Tax=Penicillium odoratum TaxID=1167516 RepID=UPI0025473560|nr:uncharacterized protein N7520_011960 [Penicillium odoratum]KAJ5746778.1 hypothetical protein N7520_011960 [Penicillium odoratum]
MAGELIFITGASGFVGSATAGDALKGGYRLRVCLRRSNHVESDIVPELTHAALAGKLDGVDYVLYVAAPVPHGTDKEVYFIPAVTITIAVLEEAASVSSDNEGNLDVDEAADFTISESSAATVSKLYHASKLLANKATWDFWEY